MLERAFEGIAVPYHAVDPSKSPLEVLNEEVEGSVMGPVGYAVRQRPDGPHIHSSGAGVAEGGIAGVPTAPTSTTNTLSAAGHRLNGQPSHGRAVEWAGLMTNGTTRW